MNETECRNANRLTVDDLDDRRTVVDKHSLLPDGMRGAALELGCGNKKRDPAAVGVDAIDYEGVDIVGDVFEVLQLIPDASLSSIYSEHFMEHIADVPHLLDELARVLRVGGTLEIIVPHFSNPYFYSDLTHRTAFGLYSLSYFSFQSPLRRKVPHYQRVLQFKLSHVDLIFKSAKPFYARHGAKKLIQMIFNMNGFMKELYEENLCYLFPCYEIKYALLRIEPMSCA